MTEKRATCAACGAEQEYGRIRCLACGKPLVFPASFVCPRCKAESFNLNDIRERYCGRCHQFADPWPHPERRA
jgi:predicted amidophosphoribosyltransferase